MEYMQKILEHGVVRNIEYVLKDKCGQEFPVETSASIVKNALGEPEFIVGVIKDITERKKMEERLSALNFYGSTLNTAKSFDEVYALILDTMQQTLGFEYGEFLTIERSKLHTVCYRGQPREIPDLPLDGEKKGIVVKAANMRKPILVRDVTKEADYVEALPEAKSELTVPVVTENRLLGVLNVESTRADSFDEKDVALLQILASHAATAIGNLEKHVEIEKRSNQLALLMKNSAVIMHVAGLHRRIQTIAEAVQELGWRRVVITARDEKLNIASSGDIVTAGLTKEEKEYMWTNRQSGEVWQERFGTEYDRFKIGQFYYMPWNDPWVRERFDKGTVPSRLKPEEMVDWNPEDLPLCTHSTGRRSHRGSREH
jgi:putative methionine-R-sulfoxide reductase with GAF domain